jgi:hypothetical protein
MSPILGLGIAQGGEDRPGGASQPRALQVFLDGIATGSRRDRGGTQYEIDRIRLPVGGASSSKPTPSRSTTSAADTRQR